MGLDHGDLASVFSSVDNFSAITFIIRNVHVEVSEVLTKSLTLHIFVRLVLLLIITILYRLLNVLITPKGKWRLGKRSVRRHGCDYIRKLLTGNGCD